MFRLTVFALVVVLLASISSNSNFAFAHGDKPKATRNQDHHHPADWRFSMPKGDAEKGRVVFTKYECFYCHRVRGESFPEPVDDAPELSQMGSMHPLEFFTESVINPSAVAGKGYRGADGKSAMATDHIDKMTLRELIDLSSYLANLRPPNSNKGPVGANGQVIAVLANKGEVVLAHDEIKGVMDAMTMGYKVKSRSLLKGLKAGDQVRFWFEPATNSITKIQTMKK